MVKCTSKSKDYIDYKCYECLKNEFRTCNVAGVAQSYLTNELKKFSTIHKFSDVKILLKWILQHLTCTKFFYDGDYNMPCKYINFWLNKQIHDLYTFEYNTYFGKFKEFVKNFYTEVNPYSGFKSCNNNIKLLHDNGDEYKKMNALYKFYKMYDDLKILHKYMDDWKQKCGNIDYIIKEANEFAQLYNNDDEFIKVLRDFREIIKNPQVRFRGLRDYINLCASNLEKIDTMVSRELIPDKVPEPPTHTEISKPSDSLQQPIPQALAQHESESRIGNQPQPKLGLQENSRTVHLTTEDQLAEVSHEISPPDESPHIELPFLAPQPRVSQRTGSHHAGNLREDVFTSATFPREGNEQSRGAHSRSTYTGYNSVEDGITTEGLKTPTDGTQSYLETFKGTITGVLGSVDPGPVLGVSGGMGALFLLFKYTPVGSFFGGRRRRIHQIPRTFGGFKPDFENFQEYDGGSIGYSPMGISPFAE
ncbi:Plasmodium vivax Vir protein, putative [Plasmodium vivax]|nr:Plasmodium vivax Vir protein, putative [Plasmodium vivax]